MPKLIVDGKEIEVSGALTLLQACEAAGAEIPRFCYHERLSIAGNCRMCLVEVVGMPKPQASCALGVSDLPPNRDGSPKIINTKTPLVKKAREGVMEFLLINHPLDCPICDQGGECDLQDQAMAYGVDTTRYGENKRAVEDKNLGPLVKTSMTRCIQCTRCVRFMAEVAGVEELGATGRGEDMEITSYLEKGLGSEMHANIIDICPVGALTSKPYAFMARPWELRKTESIDVMDAVGSAIRVDTRGREVMRILPRTNDAVNEEWISDKTRYVADGLRTQRLDQPYVRRHGKLEPATWDQAFEAIAARIKVTPGNRIGGVAGDLAAAEEMFALKDLLTRLGSVYVESRTDGALLDPRTGRASYTFNTGIAGLEQADALVLIGTNPRLEATVLNARIRKRWRTGALKVGLIGTPADLTYDYQHLGAGPAAIQDLIDGKHPFAQVLKGAKRPALIVGTAALARADGLAVQSAAARLAAATGMLKPAEGWNGFNVLHTAAARVAALDLGFVSGERIADFGGLDLIWLLGAEEFDIKRLGKSFVVYQGTHGDAGAHRADVILPGAAYTEKSGTYVNTEGRAQVTAKAGFAPGDAKEDWTILRAFSETVGQKLPYDTLNALRAAMYQTAPGLARIGTVVSGDISAECVAIEALGKRAGNLGDAPFGVMIRDTYLTNPIARASAVMAELSATGAQRGSKTATKVQAGAVAKTVVTAHG
jgi:NADH-quinone oxidoreductase subunit G